MKHPIGSGLVPRLAKLIERECVKVGHRRAATLSLLAVMLFASTVGAVPQVGQRFPVFEVPDVAGHVHSTTELTGRRTLIVAVTQLGANDGMAAWGEAADHRNIARSVHRVWMCLYNLAFIVPSGTARSTARGRTPEGAWADTWLDIHDDRYVAAGLTGSPVPWAFVLDETGTIVAAFHGVPTEPGAEAIWRALRRPAPAPTTP